MPLGAPSRPPAPRSHGHSRWVWVGGGRGPRPDPAAWDTRRNPRADGAGGVVRASRCEVSDSPGAQSRQPSAGREQKKLGQGGSYTESPLDVPFRRPALSSLCQKSSLRLLRVSHRSCIARGVCVCVCARAPFLSPLELSQSLSSWQPPPPDWTGLDSPGVPPALPLLLPPLRPPPAA